MPRRSIPHALPGTLPASHPVAVAWTGRCFELLMLAVLWASAEVAELPALRATTAVLLRRRPALIATAAR